MGGNGDIPPCPLLLLDPGGEICIADLRDCVLQISTVDNGEMVNQSWKK